MSPQFLVLTSLFLLPHSTNNPFLLVTITTSHMSAVLRATSQQAAPPTLSAAYKWKQHLKQFIWLINNLLPWKGMGKLGNIDTKEVDVLFSFWCSVNTWVLIFVEIAKILQVNVHILSDSCNDYLAQCEAVLFFSFFFTKRYHFPFYASRMELDFWFNFI